MFDDNYERNNEKNNEEFRYCSDALVNFYNELTQHSDNYSGVKNIINEHINQAVNAKSWSIADTIIMDTSIVKNVIDGLNQPNTDIDQKVIPLLYRFSHNSMNLYEQRTNSLLQCLNDIKKEEFFEFKKVLHDFASSVNRVEDIFAKLAINSIIDDSEKIKKDLPMVKKEFDDFQKSGNELAKQHEIMAKLGEELTRDTARLINNSAKQSAQLKSIDKELVELALSPQDPLDKHLKVIKLKQIRQEILNKQKIHMVDEYVENVQRGCELLSLAADFVALVPDFKNHKGIAAAKNIARFVSASAIIYRNIANFSAIAVTSGPLAPYVAIGGALYTIISLFQETPKSSTTILLETMHGLSEQVSQVHKALSGQMFGIAKALDDKNYQRYRSLQKDMQVLYSGVIEGLNSTNHNINDMTQKVDKMFFCIKNFASETKNNFRKKFIFECEEQINIAMGHVSDEEQDKRYLHDDFSKIYTKITNVNDELFTENIANNSTGDEILTQLRGNEVSQNINWLMKELKKYTKKPDALTKDYNKLIDSKAMDKSKFDFYQSDRRWYDSDDMQKLLQHRIGRDNKNVYIFTAIDIHQHVHQREVSIFESNLKKYLSLKDAKSTIIFPINILNVHWAALYINYPDGKEKPPKIVYCDPKGCPPPKPLKEAMNNIYKGNEMECSTKLFQADDDSYNCGPLTIAILENLVTNKGVNKFSNDFDISARRREDSKILSGVQSSKPLTKIEDMKDEKEKTINSVIPETNIKLANPQLYVSLCRRMMQFLHKTTGFTFNPTRKNMYNKIISIGNDLKKFLVETKSNPNLFTKIFMEYQEKLTIVNEKLLEVFATNYKGYRQSVVDTYSLNIKHKAKNDKLSELNQELNKITKNLDDLNAENKTILLELGNLEESLKQSVSDCKDNNKKMKDERIFGPIFFAACMSKTLAGLLAMSAAKNKEKQLQELHNKFTAVININEGYCKKLVNSKNLSCKISALEVKKTYISKQVEKMKPKVEDLGKEITSQEHKVSVQMGQYIKAFINNDAKKREELFDILTKAIDENNSPLNTALKNLDFTYYLLRMVNSLVFHDDQTLQKSVMLPLWNSDTFRVYLNNYKDGNVKDTLADIQQKQNDDFMLSYKLQLARVVELQSLINRNIAITSMMSLDNVIANLKKCEVFLGCRNNGKLQKSNEKFNHTLLGNKRRRNDDDQNEFQPNSKKQKLGDDEFNNNNEAKAKCCLM